MFPRISRLRRYGVLDYLEERSNSNRDAALEISRGDLLAFVSRKATVYDLTAADKAKVGGKKDAPTEVGSVFGRNIKDNMSRVLPLRAENQVKE